MATINISSIKRGDLTRIEIFEAYGRNPETDTDTDPEDVWDAGSLYTGFPTEVETLEILSDNAADDDAGTGALTVQISGLLDSTFSRIKPVTVALAGVTPVTLGVTTFTRATKIEVLTAGSSGSNTGLLTLRHSSTTANIFATVLPLENISHVFAGTVPLAETLFITNLKVQIAINGGVAGSANMKINHKLTTTEVFVSEESEELTHLAPYERSGEISFKQLPEKTDFKISINNVSSNDTLSTAEGSGYFTLNPVN